MYFKFLLFVLFYLFFGKYFLNVIVLDSLDMDRDNICYYLLYFYENEYGL